MRLVSNCLQRGDRELPWVPATLVTERTFGVRPEAEIGKYRE